MITYLFIAVCCVAVWSTVAFFVMRADRNDWRNLAEDASDIIIKMTERLNQTQGYIDVSRATITAYENMLKTYPINSDDYIPPVNGMGIDESGVCDEPISDGDRYDGLVPDEIHHCTNPDCDNCNNRCNGG